MKKRLTALLLLVCMLLTMVPMGAWAEEPGGESDGASANAAEPAPNNDPPACEHEWKAATCTEPQTCTKCGATQGTASGHSWGPWSTDDANHTRTCTACGAPDTGSHSYPSTWTASGNKHIKACLDCGKELSAEHNWGTDWVSNGNGTHSHICKDCGAKSEPEDCHVGTPATCSQPAKCKDCGGFIGEVSKKHSGTPTYTSNGDGTHTVTYSGCGHTVTEACSGGTADCSHKAVCSLCKAEYGEYKHEKADKPRPVSGKTAHEDYCKLCGVSMGNETACTETPKSNGNGTHDIVCSVCDAVLVSGVKCSYDPKTAVCSKKPTCKVCGTEYGQVLGHDFGSNGECQRPSCDCKHPNVWKGVSASAASAKCPDCGKTIKKKALTVAFTVTGFGIDKPIDGLQATANDNHVTNIKASVATGAENDTFKSGTTYTITVTYDVADGYLVTSQTINGKSAGTTSGTAEASMGNPEKLFTITYNGTDGATVKGTLVKEYTASSLPITLPDLEKTGYTFNGWTGNGTGKATKRLTIPAGTKKDLTFTASFTANKCTVTFNDGHGKTTTQTVDYGKKCPTPKTPTADDEIFDCWKKSDGTKYDFSQPVTGDFTLTASWKPAGYIYYHNASGKQVYEAGKAVTLAKPTKKGYYFCGWFTTSNFKSRTQVTKVNVEEGKTVDVYAKWKKMDTTNPKTGDTSHPELALGILALSTVSLGAVTVISKKKRIF